MSKQMTNAQLRQSVLDNIDAITDVTMKSAIQATVDNVKAKKADLQAAYDVVQNALNTNVPAMVENSAKAPMVEVDSMLPPTVDYNGKTFVLTPVANMAEFVTIAQSDELDMIVCEYITRADVKRDNLTRDGLLPISDGKKERQSYPNNIDIAIPFFIDEQTARIAYVVSVYNNICHDIRATDFDDMYNNYEFAVYTAPAPVQA